MERYLANGNLLRKRKGLANRKMFIKWKCNKQMEKGLANRKVFSKWKSVKQKETC